MTDPLFQRYFTVAWASALALSFVGTIPAILRFARKSKLPRNWEEWSGLFGVYNDSNDRRKGYQALGTEEKDSSPSQPLPNSLPRNLSKPFLSLSTLFSSFTRRSLPYISFSVSHALFLVLIPALLLATLLPQSRLIENPNRFGFLALACLPPLFLLSMKNGPIGFMLGKSWLAVNFLHRWLGRAVLGLVLCHAIIWTAQVSITLSLLRNGTEH